MKKLLGIGISLALVAVIAWLVLRETPANVPISSPTLVTESKTNAPLSEPAKLEAISDTTTREVAPADFESPLTTALAASPPPRDDDVVIRGRFLLPSGEPAAGVRLTLKLSVDDMVRSTMFGAPENSERSAGESATDGRFVVRSAMIRRFTISLQGVLPGHGAVCWSWYSSDSIGPGSVIDVGDIALVRAGSVRGRIIDSKGHPLVNGWSVVADATRPIGANRRGPFLTASPSEQSGEFVIENIPPGNVRLTTKSDIKVYTPEAKTVPVRAGEETRADLSYSGPDVDEMIKVITSSRPFSVFDGDAQRIVLCAAKIPDRQAIKPKGSVTDFIFDEIPPGSYTVELRDPRYLPWSQSDVHPGTVVRMPLTGNVSIVLHVVDDATSDAIPRYDLDVRLEQVKRLYKTFPLFERRLEPPADGVFAGLLPIEQTLVIQADGFARLEIPMNDLAANEKRTIEARLVRGRELAGVVVSSGSRKPLAGATVRIAPVRKNANTKIPAPQLFDAAVTATVATDASGRFTIPHVDVGRYELEAALGASARVTREVEIVRDTPPAEIELVVPATGRLVGKVLVPPSVSLTGFTATVVSKTKPSVEVDPFMATPPERVPVSAAGEFTSPWILAGEVAVVVNGPDMRNSVPAKFVAAASGSSIDLGTVTLSPDVDTRAEFDLRETYPANVVASVRLNGGAAEEVLVILFDRATTKSNWACVTDAKGIARIERVPAGKYLACVRDGDSTWLYADPTREFVVEVGVDAHVDIEFDLFAGTLLLRRGDPPQAFSGGLVSLVPDGLPNSVSLRVKLDASGQIQMRLPAGRWTVHDDWLSKPGTPHPAGVVVWDTSGPTPRTLDLVLTPR